MNRRIVSMKSMNDSTNFKKDIHTLSIYLTIYILEYNVINIVSILQRLIYYLNNNAYVFLYFEQ